MGTYKPTIGLEVHAELTTTTKLFCASRNDPNETRPNTNVCPVCLGYPGTLPTINREAIAHIIRLGLAVGGTIADTTYFDRKNYFYPDIPKGYQISQYKHPIVSGGMLAGVPITRIHLEEDTARSQHTDSGSLIDFNRAGVPLMELVTEPEISDAATASAFARELQLLLRYLGAGHANMEKGEMRVEVNISVSDSKTRGTKVEIKNLNSFRAVERAAAYEIERQTDLLSAGEPVVQETRGWDERTQQTFPQRLKEELQDYRYFPEPDLPIFRLSELFDSADLAAKMPELPWEKRRRYMDTHGLSKETANIFVRSRDADELFSEAVRDTSDTDVVRAVANYIATEIPAVLGEDSDGYGNINASSLCALAAMKQRGDISSRGVKEILAIMVRDGGEPEHIAKQADLLQKSDTGELAQVAEQVIAEHANVADEYRAGKETALRFLVGQGMKATQGAANPEMLERALAEVLNR